MVVSITGSDLTINEVVRVGINREPVELSPPSKKAIESSNQSLQRMLKSSTPLYGLTFGCGELDREDVTLESHGVHQRNIVLSHACGVGDPMLPEQVRAMILSRLNNFARGMSGVNPEVANCLVEILNVNIIPVVPTMGSVGASDLVPLAHMAATLMGEGMVIYKDEKMPALDAMRLTRIAPLELTGRDGLALINGLSQTNGVAAIALSEARKNLDLSVSTALLTSSLICPDSDRELERTVALKNHPTADKLVKRFMELKGDPGNGDRRSPLSIRFMPYSMAVAFDSLSFVERVVEAELNAVVDNPLISSEGWHTNNSGNMSGHRIGHALDQFGLTLIALAVASERRISQLLRNDPLLEGMPPYLIHPEMKPGTNYGLMITQYTAASLVAYLRTHAISSSVQSMSTGGTFEDLTPMSNYSAYHVAWIVRQLEAITCIELLAALQGYFCIDKEPPKGLREFAKQVREICPVIKEDRLIGTDLAKLQEAIQKGLIKVPNYDLSVD